MTLEELIKVINKNTRLIVSISYGYHNWNTHRKYDCKCGEIMKEYEDEIAEKLIVDIIEPHEGYLFISTHR